MARPKKLPALLQPPPDYFTAEELAHVLGEPLDYIRNRRRIGDLPTRLENAQWVYPHDTTLAWLRRPENHHHIEFILGAYAPENVRRGLFGVADDTTINTPNPSPEIKEPA